MNFNEKLQELRKERSLTQEQLAQSLFVSRTAVSKWESGRGYPSIDSLKEISRFFSVSIDELVSPSEIVNAAETDKRDLAGKLSLLTCGILDMLPALLLFAPLFGSADPAAPSSLPNLEGISEILKAAFTLSICGTVLCGACEAAVSFFDKPKQGKLLLGLGIALSSICVAIFIVSRQPYAGIICFAMLLAKGIVLARRA